MIAFVSAVLSLLSFRLRRRASLELEVIALRHQLGVLRRQCPRRLRLRSSDRLFWAWLYRLWPRCLEAMVLVKPATVVHWHRSGFRLYWRWRSRLGRRGRPTVDHDVRALIRQMSQANPLWGRRGSMVNSQIGIRIGRPRGQVPGRRSKSPTDLADLLAEPYRRHRRNECASCLGRVQASLRRDLLVHGGRQIITSQHSASHPDWLSSRSLKHFPWIRTALSAPDRDHIRARFAQAFGAAWDRRVVTAPPSPAKP